MPEADISVAANPQFIAMKIATVAPTTDSAPLMPHAHDTIWGDRALNSRRRCGARPREPQTDQRQLSGGHPRRLRVLIPASHLLAWKLETK